MQGESANRVRTMKRRLYRCINRLFEFSSTVGDRLRLVAGTKPVRVASVIHHPSDMVMTDRVMLYALVRGLKPNRILEIGSRWGGSARIMAAALEDNGSGRIVGLDPDTSNFCCPKRLTYGRFDLVRGYSPEDVPKAVEMLGGPPDFVFIDALHIRDAVLDDIGAAMKHSSPDCYILLHDGLHPGVHAAAEIAKQRHRELYDLGLVSRTAVRSDPVCYQGLRLLRRGTATSSRDLQNCYESVGLPFPEDPSPLENYDRFALRTGLVKDVGGELVYVRRDTPE